MARLQPIYTVKPLGWQHPKKVGHNTLVWRDVDQSYSVRYHSTVVVNYDQSREVLYINTNGWFSKTTLERIRYGLAHVGLELSTRDLKNKWRVMDHKGNAWTIRGNSLTLARDTNNNTWSRM